MIKQACASSEQDPQVRGFWTPERVEILKAQWVAAPACGRSPAWSAAAATRVIGKARRLALPMHEAASRRPDVPRKRPAKKPKAKPHLGRKSGQGAFHAARGATAAAASCPAATAGRGAAHQICRPSSASLPLCGDGGRAVFCSADRPGKEKSPYCSVHHALCHANAARRKRPAEPQRGKPRLAQPLRLHLDA